MEKINLSKQFAFRLREAMIAAGYQSHRSPSGVSIHRLTEITGYSIQICRKYLRGEAIPEPCKLIDIATKLNVSPGWLLFGEELNALSHQSKLTISRNLLHYVFSKASCLYNCSLLEHEVAEFLIDLMNDVSLINANEEQSKKIIDLALASVNHFSHPHKAN